MDLVRVAPKLENGTVVAELRVLLKNSRQPPPHISFSLTGESCLTVNSKGVVTVVGTCKFVIVIAFTCLWSLVRWWHIYGIFELSRHLKMEIEVDCT